MRKRLWIGYLIAFSQIFGSGVGQKVNHRGKDMKQTAFEAKKISRTSSIQLNASPMIVFPLFGPIEEKKWGGRAAAP